MKENSSKLINFIRYILAIPCGVIGAIIVAFIWHWIEIHTGRDSMYQTVSWYRRMTQEGVYSFALYSIIYCILPNYKRFIAGISLSLYGLFLIITSSIYVGKIPERTSGYVFVIVLGAIIFGVAVYLLRKCYKDYKKLNNKQNELIAQKITPKKKKKHKKYSKIIWLSIILSILLVTGGIFSTFYKKEYPKEENQVQSTNLDEHKEDAEAYEAYMNESEQEELEENREEQEDHEAYWKAYRHCRYSESKENGGEPDDYRAYCKCLLGIQSIILDNEDYAEWLQRYVNEKITTKGIMSDIRYTAIRPAGCFDLYAPENMLLARLHDAYANGHRLSETDTNCIIKKIKQLAANSDNRLLTIRGFVFMKENIYGEMKKVEELEKAEKTVFYKCNLPYKQIN